MFFDQRNPHIFYFSQFSVIPGYFSLRYITLAFKNYSLEFYNSMNSSKSLAMNILLNKNKSSQQTATYFTLNIHLMPPQTSTVWRQLLRFSQPCEFWSSNAVFTIAFFAAVSHLNGPLRKQNFTLTGSKGHGLWFVIGGFRSILCVCVFQGSLLVIVIMIDGSEKRNCEGGFWTLEFAYLWKAQ